MIEVGLSSKTRPFGDGDGKIENVNIQAVTIQSYEEGQFAPRGTPIVKVEALAPPPVSEDDEGFIIEGTSVDEAQDDEPEAETPEETFASVTPLNVEQASAEFRASCEQASAEFQASHGSAPPPDFDPPPAPAPSPPTRARVTQHLEPQEPDPEVIAPTRKERFPRSPQEAAGVARWLWDK